MQEVAKNTEISTRNETPKAVVNSVVLVAKQLVFRAGEMPRNLNGEGWTRCAGFEKRSYTYPSGIKSSVFSSQKPPGKDTYFAEIVELTR